MQCMTKLMEKGCHLIKCQERRFCGRWPGEIANDRNVGAFVFPILAVLRLERRHPRTVTFALSGKEISVEDSNELICFIDYFKCTHFLVVGVDMLHLMKVEPIEFLSNCKYAVQHFVQLEIRF